LCYDGKRAGTGTAGRPRNEQKRIRFRKTLAGSYRFDYLIAIFFGNLGTQLIDFANAMTARLAAANENAVMIIGPDAGQATEVGNIGVDGKDIGHDVDTALNVRLAVQSGKFVSNPAATLSKTNYN
jgi:hypothetical protein